ncbi:muconolactone Delta-isomerase [Arthrobacter sp. NicSoilB8]|uniref:muconolactone Delta-isomerase n=1 Tax=Arthrobacter sp. NicSoilB8 TaxID=2830998 RepID=UPI001CC770E1|nr:muconolactone Delta-isomerase [Arthrobacter sp. NicSoilB8]BCW71991.1 muconolactone Delta-isomerase [Arthrobacter sp. NicSoilB8]
MLYAVRMNVDIPRDMDAQAKAELLATEKAYSQKLQRQGEWQSIWRCVGEYANLSIFDVTGNERLHEILWGLPLFPYMTIDITPLAAHPSDIAHG